MEKVITEMDDGLMIFNGVCEKNVGNLSAVNLQIFFLFIVTYILILISVKMNLSRPDGPTGSYSMCAFIIKLRRVSGFE